MKAVATESCTETRDEQQKQTQPPTHTTAPHTQPSDPAFILNSTGARHPDAFHEQRDQLFICRVRNADVFTKSGTF